MQHLGKITGSMLIEHDETEGENRQQNDAEKQGEQGYHDRMDGRMVKDRRKVAPGAITWMPGLFSKAVGGLESGRPQHGSTQRKGCMSLQRVT